MSIETCYFIRCSCGCPVRDEAGKMLACDCSKKTKMPVMIPDSCEYCEQRKALNQAAIAVTSDPSLRELLREGDEPQAERPRAVLPQVDLEIPKSSLSLAPDERSAPDIGDFLRHAERKPQ